MPLPIQADLADIEAICGYLLIKPAGASLAELVAEKAIDRRKLSALKFWGLIEDAGTGLRLSERGLLSTPKMVVGMRRSTIETLLSI
jgi:hypothetical protein